MEISLLDRTFSDLSSIHWMSVKRSQRTIYHTKINCKIRQSMNSHAMKASKALRTQAFVASGVSYGSRLFDYATWLQTSTSVCNGN